MVRSCFSLLRWIRVFAEGMELAVDLIFKNQAMTPKDKGQGHFVNDLLRTEFHKFVSFLLFSCLVRIDQSRTENSWPNLSRYSSQVLIPLDNY